MSLLRFAKRAARTTSLTLSLFVLLASIAVAATTKVTILHVNDLHGRVEPFSIAADKPVVGGYARIATVIKQIKAENPSTLVLNAGDALHGTNMVNLTRGKAAVDLMNSMGFDAMALGNHDFNYGMSDLLDLYHSAQFNFLAAGLKSEDGFNPFGSAKEVNLDGVRIAIIGVATPETKILTHPDNVKGYEFPNPVEAVAKYVELFRPNVDLVVVLSHAGFDLDKKIASEVPGIDVIVGGHSHTLLETGTVVGDTLIVQDGEYGQYLGRVDLTVTDGKVASAESRLIPIDASIVEDEDINKKIAAYKEQYDKSMSLVVGQNDTVLNGERADVRTKATNLGTLIADVLRREGNADIGFMNGGGIRASIDAGPVTLGEIYTVAPFDNILVTIKVTGYKLLQALENGVSKLPAAEGRFPQLSGLEYTMDPSQPAGSRIISAYVNGVPIDKAKVYTVATNDFIAAGGDGYEWLALGQKVFKSGDYIRDMMVRYFQANMNK